jgi:hypothetical protein
VFTTLVVAVADFILLAELLALVDQVAVEQVLAEGLELQVQLIQVEAVAVEAQLEIQVMAVLE